MYAGFMEKENRGYYFWKQVDLQRGKTLLSEIASALCLNYQSIRDQRTNNRLPKLEDAYSIASYLGVSIEYILTGKDDSRKLTAEAEAVNNDPELQALVRAVLRDPNLLRVISAVVMSSEKNMGLA